MTVAAPSPAISLAPAASLAIAPADIAATIARTREPLHVWFDPVMRRHGVMTQADNPAPEGWQFQAALPPLYPEWLGDRTFQETHGTRFAYVGGEMANGIATVRMCIELARAGALGFFGAAGLPLARVEAAVAELSAALDPAGLPWGVNLIHSPDEPELESALAELFLRTGVRRVGASAFMKLAPAVVHYSAAGLARAADGSIVRHTHVFAKISRPEVARAFLEPAPAAMLAALVQAGKLTAEQAELARHVPVAEDVTVEADSGGHTDNRPLVAMFPVIAQLRDTLAQRHGFTRIPRLGAAGGLGTPQAVAAAFALGAAYVMIGSVHQACVESGVNDTARELLAQAGPADVAMTAAGDMFEQGVKVQVLKRGTQMAQRGNQLYSLYRRYDSLEQLTTAERADLEANVFGESLGAVWAATRAYLERKGDTAEIARCEQDPKHKMARVFKRYLGLTSRWALAESGDSARRLHYQVWCGPAMGAFNEWTRDTFLAQPQARTVRQVALNLLEGAAIVTRAQQLRACGVPVPPAAFAPRPEPLDV